MQLALACAVGAYVPLPRVSPSPCHIPDGRRIIDPRVRSPVRLDIQSSVEAPTAPSAPPATVLTGAPHAPATNEGQRVYPAGCPSCETDYLARSKDAEVDEQRRLAQLRQDNLSQFSFEMWEYAQRMNDTQRQELALDPDVELRNFIIKSCTAPTPLMETVYNATMTRVPYEMACYICGPEQAMLLRTLVGLARPRRALDIGSFTGYASSAIVEALPAEAELTCLEIDRDYTRLAASQLRGRPANFMVGKAMDALKRFEANGQQFDFISLDADKPLHGEYYNMSLKLLRPGGVLIMFGMLLFPTLEDQEAMEKLHEILPNDTRITTAQLPVGCGIQLMVKLDGLTPEQPLTAAELADRKRWQLESELAAIDRYVHALDVPLGGAGSSGPGTEALSSSGLVALAAARRQAEEAAAAAAAEAGPM